MNIINGPTGPYENAECTRVAQFCSTQAVNWPVWRMMNRAGVRIVFPGVPQGLDLRLGGYEATAVFYKGPFTWIH